MRSASPPRALCSTARPDGALTPTITAAEEELAAIARSMGRTRRRACSSSSTISRTRMPDGATEFAMLRRLVGAVRTTAVVHLLDISLYPGRWETLLREVEHANRDGLAIRGQVAARPVGRAVRARTVVPSLLDLPELFRDRRSAAAAEARAAARSRRSGRASSARSRSTQPPDAGVHAQRGQHVRARRSAGLHAARRPTGWMRGRRHSASRRSSLPTTCWFRGTAARSCSIPAPTTGLLRRQHGAHATARAHRDGAGRRRRPLRADLRCQLHHARPHLLDARSQGRALAASWAVQQLTDVPARTIGLAIAASSRPATRPTST